MKTKGEILEGHGITPRTAHHNYEYLYSAVVKAMQEYANQGVAKAKEEAEKYHLNLHEGHKEIFQKLIAAKDKEIQELREQLRLCNVDQSNVESENASLRAEVERLKGAFDKEIIRLKQVLGSVRWDIAKDRCVTAVETISKEIGFIP